MGNDPEAIIARLMRVERMGIEETISTTTLPCLLYIGEDDPGYDVAKASVGRLANVRFVSLPGLDHYQASQRSDLVLPYVVRFLDDQGN